MPIYSHLTLGTNDLDAARKFYDDVLGALGLKRLTDLDHATIYGDTVPELLVLKPSDGKAATVGNGTTVGFAASSRAAVHAFHEAGLAAGGKDEGAPGPRSFAPNAYAGYLRDLDGHKIVAVCMRPE